MRNPPPDQKLIARRLGLSQSTVSRALRNDWQIAQKTRQLVWKEAEALGYRPAPLIAARASKEHSQASHLRNAPIAALRHTHPDYAGPSNSLYEMFRQAAGPRGFVIEEIDLAQEPSIPALRRRLYARGFQGLFIQFQRGSTDWFSQFDFSGFAVVSMVPEFENEPIVTIRPRQHRVSRELYKKMRGRGYRRIGAVLWRPGRHQDDAARLAGFVAAQVDEAQGAYDPDSCFLTGPGGYGVDTGEEQRQFTKWLRRFQPDALICVSPRESSMLENLPRAMARPAFAVLLRPSEPDRLPGVAGFTRNSEAVGRLAVESLEQSIRLRQTGLRDYPVLISVPPLWLEGDSLPHSAR